MVGDDTIRYRIDERDQIVFVGPGWDQFAIANGCVNLSSDAILGRIVWDFIADHTTRQLYGRIFACVRQGKPISFELRCDGPSIRRLLAVSIVAMSRGEIEFSTRVLKEEHREPVLLLTGDSARSNDLVTTCAWCERIHVGENAWMEVEPAIHQLKLFGEISMPRLSHGICPACLEKMLTVIETGGESASE